MYTLYMTQLSVPSTRRTLIILCIRKRWQSRRRVCLFLVHTPQTTCKWYVHNMQTELSVAVLFFLLVLKLELLAHSLMILDRAMMVTIEIHEVMLLYLL